MLLGDFVEKMDVRILTAHTRNPSLLRALGNATGGLGRVYPLEGQLSQDLVTLMPYITQIDGIYYHVNRYGDDGLYGQSDPAERPVSTGDLSLKSRFVGLENIGTALVVVASAGVGYE